MKRNPLVGGLLSLQRWSRWARCMVVGIGAAASASLWAQSVVGTLTGTVGTPGFSNTSPVTFRFTNPSGVAVDSSGNLFVADAVNNVIRKVTISGSTVTVSTFAGSASGVAGSADGNGTSASFSSPQGIAIDGTNTLYVADSGNNIIRKITPSGDVVTLAGMAGAPGYVNGTGTTARFNAPFGVATDRAGGSGAAVNIFVADSQNNVIRQVAVGAGTQNSGVVTTLAGAAAPATTSGSTNNSNNVGTDARFNNPVGIASNAAGTLLFVTDKFNNLIRQITVTGGTNVNVTTLAGSGSASYAEGTTVGASFNQPAGIALNNLTSPTAILVSDTLNHVIRSITTGGVTSLLAGTPGASGSTDGLATNARFFFPTGIATNGTTTFVIDTNNHVVRTIGGATGPTISVQPTSVSVAAGSSATFSVTASGNPPLTYQWQSSTDSGSTWQNLTNGVGGASGVTTNQLTLSSVSASQSNTQYRVAISNGLTNINSNTVSLTVTQAPAFTSAASTTFVIGQSNSFSVTATGVPAPDISVTGGSYPTRFAGNLNGTQVKSGNQTTATISGTPTDATDSPFTFTITASNGVGTAATQSFTLTVATTTPPILSTVANQQVGSGATSASFSVSASGSPTDFTYQWQRSTDAGGNWVSLTDTVIDGALYSGTSSGSLTINSISPAMNTNLFRVVVTSGGGTTTSNAATLRVAPTITSPASAIFATGQFGSFTFTAAGNPSPTITVTLNGTLPNGLSLNAPFLSGVPTDTFGSTFMTVTATNSGGTVTQNFTLSISSPLAPVITSASSATFSVGQASSFTFTAAGAPTPTIQLLGSLPSGVTYNSVNGVLSGTPTTAVGSPFTLTAQANNASGTTSQTFTLTVLGVAPVITTHPTSVTANVGQTVSFSAAATGTPTPSVRWQRLPSGTTTFVDLFDDGVFSGTSTSTLTIVGVTAAMSLDQFRLVATNGTPPDAVSNAAQLTLNLGSVISTIAGSPGFPGATDGSGSSARFNSPSQIAVDFSGTVYIADTANHTIRKMTPNGVVTTMAGSPGFSGAVDGTGSEARFNSPQGVAVDGVGNVFVADTFNHAIRQISPSGIVTTIAGTLGISGAIDANGLSARFSAPTALAVDLFGNIYVADTSNHAIRRITPARDVTTIAGVLGASGSSDGNGSAARFTSPSGIAVDSSGTVYVADSLNQVIRRVSGSTVTTLAGLSGNAGIVDGFGSNARFNRPTGIAADNSGNLLIADTLSSTIRKLVIATGEVTTLAGLAITTGSTDGAGNTARFNQPIGIAIDSGGTLYVADTRNQTIRRSGSASPPQFTVQPVDKVAAIGETVTFRATATGAPTPGYQWQRAAAGSFENYINLTNDATYSGVTTSTLTISNVTPAMTGDRFRVIANNGVPSAVTSNSAGLTVGRAPVFTSAASAEFQAGRAGSFTARVDSETDVTFSATGLPPWATLDPTSGVISGNPPDTSGSPFSVTITANNGISVTQTLMITVTPAVIAPSITTQPATVVVNQGDTATFSVAVSGTAPFTYQWRRDGVALSGVTNSSVSLAGARPSIAGAYTVVVTNAAGNVTSNTAFLVVNTPAAINTQPQTQVAVAGSNVAFTVAATGGAGLSYQWRHNGVAIPGATGASFAVNNVSAADAGNYDVVVTNSLGVSVSSTAQLTIASGPVAPTITAQPISRTVLVGRATTLSIGATGVPAPSYQWRKDGVAIPGANGATFSFSSAQSADAGTYDVIVSSSSGTVTSASAALRVIARSYAGIYFGSFGGVTGNFALYVRDDNTGVFLGYLPGSVAPILGLNITVNDTGSFSFAQSGIQDASASIAGEPVRAAALGSVTVGGTIGTDGSISGSVSNGVSASLSGSRAADTGPTQNVAGFYQAGSSANGATAYTIAGPNSQAFVVAQSGSTYDGGLGVVNSAGGVNVNTGRTNINELIVSANGTITGSSTGAVTATLSGGSDATVARQRLLNISSRARVTADSAAIAGFVISGQESKPVLIRAVGPTLASAFGLSGALTTPKLELFRGSTSLQVNSGVGANRTSIDAAGVQAGAFAIGATDAAILTTLPPGAYTAVVSSTSNAAGIALVEVYDLSAAAAGQNLLNISTRANAGTNDDTLTAGFVVPPGPAKRLIVRAIGPGLTPFGVTGVLNQPVLTVLNGSTAVASNTNWRTSSDQNDLTNISQQVGGFPLATNDSAVLVTLPPGNYTAQVTGTGGTTGVALIEVYEVP